MGGRWLGLGLGLEWGENWGWGWAWRLGLGPGLKLGLGLGLGLVLVLRLLWEWDRGRRLQRIVVGDFSHSARGAPRARHRHALVRNLVPVTLTNRHTKRRSSGSNKSGIERTGRSHAVATRHLPRGTETCQGGLGGGELGLQLVDARGVR